MSPLATPVGRRARRRLLSRHHIDAILTHTEPAIRGHVHDPYEALHHVHAAATSIEPPQREERESTCGSHQYRATSARGERDTCHPVHYHHSAL